MEKKIFWEAVEVFIARQGGFGRASWVLLKGSVLVAVMFVASIFLTVWLLRAFGL